MITRPRLLVIGSVVAVIALVTGGGIAASFAAEGAPTFQLPFQCGEEWIGTVGGSSAHKAFEIDFNQRGEDEGKPVLAVAAGTVVGGGLFGHQGNKNRFGNLVVIDHGRYRSYYAHLKNIAAGIQGDKVKAGQKIGTVGNTSAEGNGISPHLHFEIRDEKGGAWPDNIRAAEFNGRRFPYPADRSLRKEVPLTSKNCGGSEPEPADDTEPAAKPAATEPAKTTRPAQANPHTPTAVCGSTYGVVDHQDLRTDGSLVGTVYLLYSRPYGKNCVVTIKRDQVGKKSPTTAWLQVKGQSRVADPPNGDSTGYSHYAGPITAKAAWICVKWGGSVGHASYESPDYEHCRG